jgi:hypothetical protein
LDSTPLPKIQHAAYENPVNTESQDGGSWQLDSAEPLWTRVSGLTLAVLAAAAAVLRFLSLRENRSGLMNASA